MRAYRWYRNHCEKVIRSTRETATDPGQYREQVQRSGGIDLGGVFASFLLVVCLIIFTVWVAAKVVLSLSPGSDSIIGRIA
jgi:flagellar biogenesis protein FliO